MSINSELVAYVFSGILYSNETHNSIDTAHKTLSQKAKTQRVLSDSTDTKPIRQSLIYGVKSE